MNGSLKTAANFVAVDLRALGHQVPFVPEQIALGDYTFLPYVRTGLAAALVAPLAGAVRPPCRWASRCATRRGGASP
jgi:hypothetical protein